MIIIPPPLKPEWRRHPISSKRKFIRQFRIHIFISLVIISQLDSQIGHVADTHPTTRVVFIFAQQELFGKR